MEPNDLCLGCFEKKGTSNNCPNCGYVEGLAPNSLLHLPPGSMLLDKYLIGKVLGQGGFGITYMAWDSTLNLKLAIKEYMPQNLATRSAGQNNITIYNTSLNEQFKYGLTKFLEEARTLANFIEHPNIVSVRDFFEANGTAYLVMSYHEGFSLQDYLSSKGENLDINLVQSIFMPVLDALRDIHNSGILHRDISPDNLIVNTRGQVILVDFGAARQAMSEKSQNLSVIMKAGYSPEEQYRSKGEQGPWTDIYAVAATMYRAITGQMPPESLDRLAGDNLIPPSKLGVEIDPIQEQALLKALSVRAKDRYRNIDEFQEEFMLGKVVASQPLNVDKDAVPEDVTALGDKGLGKESLSGSEGGIAKEQAGISQDASGAASNVLSFLSGRKAFAILGLAAAILLVIFLTQSNPVYSLPRPDQPAGQVSGFTGQEMTYTVEEITCPEGGTVEYRFFSDGKEIRSWKDSPILNHQWLEPGAYEVRVQVRSTVDTAHASELSSPLNVVIDKSEELAKPSPAQQIKPENQEVVSNKNVRFEWAHVEGADYYLLTIIRTSDYQVVVNENVGNRTTYEIDKLEDDNEVYMWSVAAGNMAGLSDWSEYYSFTYGQPVEAPVSPSGAVSKPTTSEAPASQDEPKSKSPRELMEEAQKDLATEDKSGSSSGGSSGSGGGWSPN